jgi:hypothetical protein
MKRFSALAIAALVAGCATPGPVPTADWLVGTWLRTDQGVEYPRLCDTGLPIHYSADGTWQVFEGNGTWRLEGDRLTEVTLDTAADEIPPPATFRIVRAGADEFRRIGSDGAVATLRRCPAAE